VSARGDLVVRDLHVQYGPAKALLGVSLEVESGSVMAVLGPNGAGKSTLARAVSGLVPVTSGSVTFAGTDITGRPTHRIRRAGLTYLPEGRGIFPALSVMDNLRMATRQLNRGDRTAAMDLAIDLFPILGERRRQRAGTLSGGEQQMLALARALAVHPALIIADELSLGLAPLVADKVFEGLDHAREVGITIILIEQFIHRALELADSCAILSRGTVSWSGASSGASDEVLERYLGEAADENRQPAR
jgi:branched-chain amino acid transport system ATP-binding protein